MKRIFNIAIAICMILCIGCQKQDVAPPFDAPHGERVVISMSVYNSSSETRASGYSSQGGVLGEAEYLIDRLRVVVFASDGSLEANMLFAGLNANHIITKELEVLKDRSKELYIVANEPLSASAELEAVTSVAELKQLDYEMVSDMIGGFTAADTFDRDKFLMPMSATCSVANASADVAVVVALKRSVARVDLFLKKGSSAVSRDVKFDGSTKLSAAGLTENSVRLFEGEVESRATRDLAEMASSDVTLSSSLSQRVLSFYVAERLYDIDAEPITITLDDILEGTQRLDPLSVKLGEGIKDENGTSVTLSKIQRNHIYKINGSYNGVEIVADDLDILDWEDVYVDGEIEGVMVAVDSEVEMDWLRNGNSYESKSISFGSNKPIEFYLPVSTTSSDDEAPDFEFKLFTFDNMSAGSSYDLKSVALANNYIFAAKWIESATIHFTSPQSGYLKFTYSPVKVNYKIQSYPIRIKSDNVTAQMKAVYDNGYIPVSALSEGWALRAPGGVVFAKRGEAQHPITTDEVFYRDEDGYYRGEYKLTAEEASRYCAERFGKGWHLPSYSDMQEIAAMYDMLGVSYRFQNNGSDNGSGNITESRYWTSTLTDGQYWTADFMSRSSMMDDLMERRDGAESHFVRCIMNLQ